VKSPRFLLDTNIVIYIRQARPPEVLRRFEQLEPGEAVLSVITYGELLFGIEKLQSQAGARVKLAEFASLVTVSPLPVGAGHVYGRVRAHLSSRGEMIGSNDLWIACHALAAGLVLVTGNTREFARVPELQLENWRANAAQ
jgi:tRNA(fMet)-specific endonuclease VapC